LQPSFEKDFQTLKEDVRTKPSAKHYEKVLTLPVPMRNAKTLLKLLRLQLQGNPPPAPIQKIYMTADAAAPRVAQNGLFVPCGPDPEKLEVTIARLGKLVGEGNLGCAELLDSHRPESFRMKRFAVANEQKRRGGEREPNIKQNSESCTAITAFRVMRPAQAVRVEMKEQQPTRVYLRGLRGEVVAASGPWRSSGDWWQEDAWHQDEWDLAITFPVTPKASNQKSAECRVQGLYRIYYDALKQGWFLRGVYD